MRNFSVNNTTFKVQGRFASIFLSWTTTCPTLNIKDMYLCPASYRKHQVLAIARNTIAKKQKCKAYNTIAWELSQAYSQAIEETL